VDGGGYRIGWWVILCHSVVTCLAEIMCYQPPFPYMTLTFTHFRRGYRESYRTGIPWFELEE